MEKLERLRQIIKDAGRAGIAVSGGVDSTFLARIASEVSPFDTMPIMASSVLSPPGELTAAREAMGAFVPSLVIVQVEPLAWPEFVANPPNRCYLCKKKLYSLLLDVLRSENISLLMDGTNLDDLDEDRPGLVALRELEVMTPLAEAGLTKKEIRGLSRSLGLPTWNKPSSSCLATRIPPHTEITRERLSMVARCEEYLGGLGFSGCRVRMKGESAHVELLPGDFAGFLEESTRRDIHQYFTGLGFVNVLVDIKERKIGR